MKRGDYIGLVVFVEFGLWWVLFPKTVIRFYERFHRRRVALPKYSAIRVIGLLWVALVLAIMLLSFG